MDLYCRKVLFQKLPIMLDSSLAQCAGRSACLPLKAGDLNTDEGPQFMYKDCRKIIKSKGIKMSINGQGRLLTISSPIGCGEP